MPKFYCHNYSLTRKTGHSSSVGHSSYQSVAMLLGVQASKGVNKQLTKLTLLLKQETSGALINPCVQHIREDFGHDNISTAILLLPLIQEERTGAVVLKPRTFGREVPGLSLSWVAVDFGLDQFSFAQLLMIRN